MIVVKTAREIQKMQDACTLSARALKLAGEMVEPGVSTLEIDTAVRKFIEGEGGVPSTLGYEGYPASTCISVNSVVVHGIPSKKTILRQGDIVSIDIMAGMHGYHGDNAYTYPCGDISDEAQRLLDATKESLYEGIRAALAGNRIGDIGSAVQRYVEARGYSVVRNFTGHGVGTNLHEDPSVPNYGTPGRGPRLIPGMTIAIEPMITAGDYKTRILGDGWTAVTADGSLAAHFEHTVCITPDGPRIMTLLN
ncbi:MAG: type I methionyl aminopeptidase [Ruminococcus sp.]|nr:type I methionyl aminopeptidase [Ruminococcus sp.]